MADFDNPHFNQILRFIWYLYSTIFIYACAVTFLHIPKENTDLAHTIVIFLLGTGIGSGIGYLLGGNPVAPSKKAPLLPENSDNTITAQISTTTVSDSSTTLLE